jgi:hypothetical protein
MRYLALAMSILMVFSGCSTFSYSGRPVTVPKIETMPVWRTEGPVTIGVDPYIETDRQKEVFDDDLKKVGVLPIYLLVRNNSDRPLSLRRADTNLDITLELPDGQKTWLMNTEAVLPTATPRAANGHSDSKNVISGMLLLFPLIPLFIAGFVAEKKADAARLADYKEKEFKNVKLNKDESTHGFVFFFPYHEKGKLVLRFVDETGGSSFVRLPIIINC